MVRRHLASSIPHVFVEIRRGDVAWIEEDENTVMDGIDPSGNLAMGSCQVVASRTTALVEPYARFQYGEDERYNGVEGIG